MVDEEGAVERAVDDAQESLASEFDPKWREPFEGLLYLGHLEETVEIAGHTFVVRTLKTGEKLEALQLCKPYEDSVSFARAYRAAIAAAGLVSVDGLPVLVPQKQVSAVRQKFDYITSNWYDHIIERLYEEIDRLEGKVVKILEELGVVPSREYVAEVTGEGTEQEGSSGQGD